jgi:hypothetical protein
VIRLSWLPANLAAAIGEIEQIGPGVKTDTASESPIELIGRAAIGAGLMRIAGDVVTQTRTIEQLRSSSAFGNVVLLRGSSDLKAAVDVWGSPGDRGPLFSALKQAFDPRGILSPGRGPL